MKRIIIMAIFAVLALTLFLAVPAFAAPGPGGATCGPWDWAWFGYPGHWYWQFFQWCQGPGGWYQNWGSWGWW